MATSYYNVDSILRSVGALTETEAILPTGTDLDVRIQYINDALGEWADTYTWQDLNLTKTFTLNADQGPLTAMSLPTTFREPLSAPYVTNTVSGIPTEYALVNKSQRFKMNPDDRYSYISGEFMNKSIYINASLASGTVVEIDYMAFPTTVTSTSDFVPISSSQYLVKRVAAMVFQARGDARFPGLQADAQRLLSNAIEEQNVPFGRKNQIPIANSGFTIGVDG